MFVRQLVIAGAFALPTFFTHPLGVPRTVAPAIGVTQSVVADARSLAESPPAPWAEADPADSLYREARETLNRGEYRRAAALFGQITQRYPSSTYAADALYWRAFALYRSGSENDLRDALRALSDQRARYPKAATTADAGALEVRIHGVLARRGDRSSAAAVSTSAAEQTTCASGGDRDACMGEQLFGELKAA